MIEIVDEHGADQVGVDGDEIGGGAFKSAHRFAVLLQQFRVVGDHVLHETDVGAKHELIFFVF